MRIPVFCKEKSPQKPITKERLLVRGCILALSYMTQHDHGGVRCKKVPRAGFFFVFIPFWAGWEMVFFDARGFSSRVSAKKILVFCVCFFCMFFWCFCCFLGVFSCFCFFSCLFFAR